MKPLQKYVYMSPETEVLSLETKIVVLADSPESDVFTPPSEGNDPALGAPWRF